MCRINRSYALLCSAELYSQRRFIVEAAARRDRLRGEERERCEKALNKCSAVVYSSVMRRARARRGAYIDMAYIPLHEHHPKTPSHAQITTATMRSLPKPQMRVQRASSLSPPRERPCSPRVYDAHAQRASAPHTSNLSWQRASFRPSARCGCATLIANARRAPTNTIMQKRSTPSAHLPITFLCTFLSC